MVEVNVVRRRKINAMYNIAICNKNHAVTNRLSDWQNGASDGR